MNKLILATEKGIVFCEKESNDWTEASNGLTDQDVTSVTAREGMILAGTTNGIFRSDDKGQTWKEASNGLTARHIRWMAFHPDGSNLVLAGTEPANIFLSHDNGDTWRACPEVAQLRDQFRWSLPYSPEAGCVRGFDFHGDRAYAAVEVGGVLRSDDLKLTVGKKGAEPVRLPLPSPAANQGPAPK